MNRLEIFQEVYGKDYMFTETELSRLHQVAELIVRECVEKIGENFVGAVGTHASAYNSAVLKCQTIIKEHFGIEDVD